MLDPVKIHVYPHHDEEEGNHFVAEYENESGLIVWSEYHETLEDARKAYADYAASGRYHESL